jgi:hypothetical protein
VNVTPVPGLQDDTPATHAESFVGYIIEPEGEPNTTLGVPEIISTTQLLLSKTTGEVYSLGIAM